MVDIPPMVPAMVESISEAKAHFSAIVEGAQSGRTYVICRAGRPIAILSPYTTDGAHRRIGLLKGKLKLPANWYRKDRAMDQEIEQDTEGVAK